MTRFGPPLVTAHSVVGGPSSPQLGAAAHHASDDAPGLFDHSLHQFPPPPHAAPSSAVPVPVSSPSSSPMMGAVMYESLKQQQQGVSPLAAAMAQQLHEVNGVAPSASDQYNGNNDNNNDHGAARRLSLNQLQALQAQSFTRVGGGGGVSPAPAGATTAAEYAAMLEDFDQHRGQGAELPAMYSQRLWMQPREVNIVFGRDVIQVPLKVNGANNEYVNLVLSHREFDVMAVHIAKYDEMPPAELLDEITRHLKEQAEKQKHRRHAFPLSNQLGEFPDSGATFQARILELEYELSRLHTKLAAARALQATLTDENTLLRSNLQELEQRRVENETLKMQNDALRDQSVEAFAQNTKLKTLLKATTQQLQQLAAQVRALRTQVHFEQSEVAAQVDTSMHALIATVRDREHVLQESYLAEKKERQLMAEKYYEMSGRIRVFCRLRPVTRRVDKPVSTALLRPKPNALLVDRSGKEFSFDQVFGPENSQADVYAQMEPVVVSFVDGYNACIMAYGQTGAGKTFTMMGGAGEAQGMIPRALQQVFAIVNARQLTYKDTLNVSMVEIYNDQILDLLTEGEAGVKIKSENEITLRSVTLWEHVNAVLGEGNANRNIASTSMNMESSRSHALVFLHLESQHRETLEIRRSTLCLVDLAGSERISRSQVEGDRLKETQHINKSLSALGDVMHALQHKAKHVPYRNSKLTYMLREMLSGQAKTLMMLQLSPEDDDIEETVCSLQFGARVSQIQMGAVKTSVESGEIFKLKEENRGLEKKLAQLEEQASAWKQESRETQDELNHVRDRNLQLEAELGQQQDDLTLLQEKFEAAAVASAASTASPPASPQKSDAPPLSPTLSAHSARSSRSVTSTSSAPAAVAAPTPSRYGASSSSPAPARTTRVGGVASAASRSSTTTTARPSPRSLPPREFAGASTTAPTAAERTARRKSLTTLSSPSASSVLAARERLARAAKEPAAQANRRATLGAIGASASQPHLTSASSTTPRTRAAAAKSSSSAASLTPTRPAPTTSASSTTPRTRTRTAAISAALRAPASTAEKRRSPASSRSAPSSTATARTRTTASTTTAAASGSRTPEPLRRSTPSFAV